MENNGRKVNLTGGNSENVQENTRGPYRKDVFQEFASWSVMTKEERKKSGIPNAKSFARGHNIHESQLSRWAQRTDWNALRVKCFQIKLTDFIPEAFGAVRRRIKKHGTAKEVELWLAYAEGWIRTKSFVPPAPPPFTEDDLRTLIGYLPKEEQIGFRRVLAEILLRAEQARDKENGFD